MNGYFILMIIFGILIILSGIYVYTGHDGILWRGYYRKASREYLRYIGKTIMLVGTSPIISGIVSIIVEENSLIPVIILIGLVIIDFAISIKFFSVDE